MGCGASASKKPKDIDTADTVTTVDDGDIAAEPEPVAATWATKTDVSKLAANEQKKAVASSGVKHQTHLTMTDADADDESDIEIICEGNGAAKSAHVSAANGQEAMEEMSDELESKPEPKIELSKGQQKEADKLAEQRRRFDNQRYQKEKAASNTTTNTAPQACVVGTSPIRKEEPVPRHEPHQVMGLNFTEVRKVEDNFMNELPPGAIAGDTPRKEVPKPKKKGNKHDVFDDDDEFFMQEILDTCG